jgi:hypothetical protein
VYPSFTVSRSHAESTIFTYHSCHMVMVQRIIIIVASSAHYSMSFLYIIINQGYIMYLNPASGAKFLRQNVKISQKSLRWFSARLLSSVHTIYVVGLW